MKKVRIFLSATVVMVAAVAAIATAKSPFTTGWIFVSSPVAHCVASMTPCNGGANVCLDSNNNIIYDNNVVSGTTCGNTLRHN